MSPRAASQPDEGEVQRLVREAQGGNSDSAGQLFDLLFDRVYQFLSHRTPTQEIAEDLAQTVFLEMLQALPRYKQQRNAKFSTWLFQIARFRLIDFYRRQRVEPGLDEVAEISIDIHHADPIAADAVNAAVRQLPERYATILELRFRQDLSVEETAEIMKTTTTNVRVLQHRALKALRKLMPPSFI